MTALAQIRRLRRTTLLCLLLLCWSGAAQALHHHQNLVRGDAPDKTRCSICAADHTPQQAAVRVEVLPTRQREFAVSLYQLPALATVSSDATRIRPPPDSL